MLRKLFISAALGAISFGASASALTAQQSVFKEIAVQTETGATTYERVQADTIIPGDRVAYSLTYTNDKNESAEDIVLTMPVPDAVAFIDGTASSANTSIMYSVDKGASFGPRETRMVVSDEGAMRPARADEVTHVRWTVTAAVAPGEQGELSFAGLLR